MSNLLKNISIFFGNRINVCIIVLMLFIILIYILNKDDDQINIYNKNNNTIKQQLIPVNFPEGNYRIKNNKGVLLTPNNIDKFGFNNKTNEYFNNKNNFWKIKKYNNYYIFDKKTKIKTRL
jgi:hypothetical protein